MNYLQTIILGVIQGLTEFLPVSSSGHLAVFEKLFAVEKTSNFFEVLLHVGTMGAIVAVFYKDVVQLLRSFFVFIFGNAGKEDIKRFKMCLYIILALIPTGVIGFYVDKRYLALSGNLFAVGMMFIITAVVLFLTREAGAEDEGERPAKKTNWLLALIIGIAQGIATLPGISRSGATISAGIVAKMEKSEAVRFSFLIAIPAMAGAMNGTKPLSLRNATVAATTVSIFAIPRLPTATATRAPFDRTFKRRDLASAVETSPSTSATGSPRGWTSATRITGGGSTESNIGRRMIGKLGLFMIAIPMPRRGLRVHLRFGSVPVFRPSLNRGPLAAGDSGGRYRRGAAILWLVPGFPS